MRILKSTVRTLTRFDLVSYVDLLVRLRLDIKDGVTIHLVIRAPKTESMATTGSAATGETPAGANPPNAGQPSAGGFPFGLNMAPGMGNLNFANTNFLDMQQQLQQQVLHLSNTSSAERSCRSFRS